VPQTYDPHDLNVIGAFALATADQLLASAADSSGSEGASNAALVTLAQADEGRTINSLAQALRVSHSRAVRIGDGLERDGLARRVPSSADGRVVHLRLTAKGKAAARRVRRARGLLLEDRLTTLDASEVAELARLASKVLYASATGRERALAICRLCDAVACGHFEGACPVTNGADAHEARR
jgi:DNA-binding MarR family transcriptional regulator